MKLATQTHVVFDRFGYEKGVKMFAEAGFDALDFSLFDTSDTSVLNQPNYKEQAKRIKEAAEKAGLTFTQSHAPFPPFKYGNDEYNARVMPMVERALEISGIVGVEVCCVHPVAGENQFEVNMDYYKSIEHFAAEGGFRIGVENMWGWSKEKERIVPNICSVPEDFNRYVDALPREQFTGLLDLGHCGLVDIPAEDMLRAMGGDRVTALHIHDNDNQHDQHTVPYNRKMNWHNILKALAEIHYNGHFTYEADNFLAPLPDEMILPALRYMVALGRNMMAELASYQKAE